MPSVCTVPDSRRIVSGGPVLFSHLVPLSTLSLLLSPSTRTCPALRSPLISAARVRTLRSIRTRRSTSASTCSRVSARGPTSSTLPLLALRAHPLPLPLPHRLRCHRPHHYLEHLGRYRPPSAPTLPAAAPIRAIARATPRQTWPPPPLLWAAVPVLSVLQMVLVLRAATWPCQMPISSSVVSLRRRRKSPFRTGSKMRPSTQRQPLRAAPFHHLLRARPHPHPPYPPPPLRLSLPHLRQQLLRQPSDIYHTCWSGSSSTLASIFITISMLQL